MAETKIYQWEGFASYMIVQFDSYQNKIAKGEIKNFLLEKSISFTGLDQLLLAMDQIMDEVKRPEKEVSYRHFFSSRATTIDLLHGDNQKEEKIEDILFEEETSDEKTSKKKHCWPQKIVIQIYRRQNASMQGEIKYQNETVRFRSALELLHLLYEYLEWF